MGSEFQTVGEPIDEHVAQSVVYLYWIAYTCAGDQRLSVAVQAREAVEDRASAQRAGARDGR